MIRRSAHPWRSGAALFVGLAAAGCDAFTTVTIPVSDHTVPVAFAGVWYGDGYQALSGGSNPALSYEVADPNNTYILVGAGIDDGGTRKVTINHEFVRVCISGDLGQQSTGTMAPVVEIQAGSIGSSVSNGVWDAVGVRLNDYATCNPGYTLQSVSYVWSVAAEDFHGNTASHGWAQIYWSP